MHARGEGTRTMLDAEIHRLSTVSGWRPFMRL